MSDKFAAMLRACASRPHGTRARYRAGCRCLPCRAANSRYEAQRQRLRRQGDWNGIVDAAPVRRHILWLSRNSVGRDAVSAAADVSVTVINQIRSGVRVHCRARTARRILALDLDARSGGSHVPARQSWSRLTKLLRRGYSKAQLARWLGYHRPTLEFNRRRITARNAMRIDRLARLIDRGALRRSS
jgi:hypothetical protein